jgi:hypothetical protein
VKTKELYDWYYCPGEIMLSIGFFKNPYRQWSNAPFRHIFAFDAICNLYVGQYSVYSHHMNKICDLDDQREYGILYPPDSKIPPEHTKELNETEGGSDIQRILPIVEFKFLESKNIIYLNKRLKKISQRLYDYGMPEETILFSKEVDLWNPRIGQILKDDIIKHRPAIETLQANL